MIRRPPRSTPIKSSAASDVYKRQVPTSMAGWLKSIESVLEKVDKKTAETLASQPKKDQLENQEDIFSFLNEPIKEAKLKQEENRRSKSLKPKPVKESEGLTIGNSDVELIKNNSIDNLAQEASGKTENRKDSIQPLPNVDGKETLDPHVVEENTTSVTPLEDVSTNSTEEEGDQNVITDLGVPDVELPSVESVSPNQIKEDIQQNNEQTIEEEDNETDNANILALENKLLREQIINLNRDLLASTMKHKELKQDYEKVLWNYSEIQKSVQEKDKKIKEMKSNLGDIDGVLATKASSMNVLQLKLDQSQQELKMLKEKLSQQEIAAKKHTMEIESTNHARLNSEQVLIDKLSQLETQLSEQENRSKQLKAEYLDKQRQLENDISELTNSLATNQRSLQEKSTELSKTSIQLKQIQEKYKSSKQELADYKQRATKVLFEKEKLISSLNNGDVPLVTQSEASAERDKLADDLKQAAEDKRRLLIDLNELNYKLNDLEEKSTQDTKQHQLQLKDMDQQLQREKKNIQALHLELASKSHEIVLLNQELDREREAHQKTIKSKQEIQKVQNQSTRANPASSQEELENRLQSLTEHLIQKQNQLENALSEKQYLQLQLENVVQKNSKEKERELEDYVIKVNNETSRRNRNGSQSERNGPRLRSLASMVESTPYYETNQSSALSRRVVGAARFLDSVSTITGIYLGNYPLIRLAVIIYVVFLHLWVTYVFMTFNPEVHHDSK
eukprot:TRINITY_DN803_c0_g1_i2.p1 TRINITY_DN803_c0_g1~~TRINITY_DN803_c0_g1_i2.p1  ORF type:complete len:735 (-),score=198.23 TRINITY_DN803_c0_g1_i2:711-2915(-)